MDSGASHHMVYDVDYLNGSVYPMCGYPFVHGVGGSPLHVIATGSMILTDEAGRSIVLSNDLFFYSATSEFKICTLKN